MDRAISMLEGMLTPEFVFTVAITLAATHLLKIFAEYWLDTVTESASRWRAFCAGASVLIGALAGTVAWIATAASWFIVPAVALGSGPAWRLAKAILPGRVARAFMTSTDIRYRRKHDPG